MKLRITQIRKVEKEEGSSVLLVSVNIDERRGMSVELPETTTPTTLLQDLRAACLVKFDEEESKDISIALRDFVGKELELTKNR